MHPLPVNVMILAPFDEEQYPGRVFPGYIAAIHNDGQSYDVQYDDGDFRPNVDVRVQHCAQQMRFSLCSVVCGWCS